MVDLARRSASTAPAEPESEQIRPRGGQFDVLETIYSYRPWGWPQIRVGEVFGDGRYRIVDKSADNWYTGTQWIARDQSTPNRLVTLNALSDEISHASAEETPQLFVPKVLRGSPYVQQVENDFYAQRPYGEHRFIIHPLTGANVAEMGHLYEYIDVPKRLRADLARKTAKRTAMALCEMHHAGIAHGNLSTESIYFPVKDLVAKWTNEKFKSVFGDAAPEEIEVKMYGTNGPSIPTTANQMFTNGYGKNWKQPLDPKTGLPVELPLPWILWSVSLTHSALLEEETVLGGFHASYYVDAPPSTNYLAPPNNYVPPEALCTVENNKVGRSGYAGDVWMFACTLFALRAGRPVFTFEGFRYPDEVLKQMVEVLGKLPEPWWSTFKERGQWFDEDGEPKPAKEGLKTRQAITPEGFRPGVKLFEINADENWEDEDDGIMIEPAVKTSIKDLLRQIGEDERLGDMWGPMFEKDGMKMEEEEVELFGDLLEKMLRYCPEERITMEQVVAHPWFSM